MPNRILKESIWTSENLCKASIPAQGFFLRLLPLPDDHGCFDARVAVLRSRLFPLNYTQVSEKQIEGWLQELMAVDCIRIWTEAGVRYGYLPGWNKHQQVRSLHHRKTPAPPLQVLTTEGGVENKDDINCNQLLAVDALNPNLNPNPKQTCASATSYSGEFESFWASYPKKVGKIEAYKAWRKINPSETLQRTIIAAIGWQKRTPQWQANDGRYIPNPATWLNRGQWEDSPPDIPEPERGPMSFKAVV